MYIKTDLCITEWKHRQKNFLYPFSYKHCGPRAGLLHSLSLRANAQNVSARKTYGGQLTLSNDTEPQFRNQPLCLITGLLVLRFNL